MAEGGNARCRGMERGCGRCRRNRAWAVSRRADKERSRLGMSKMYVTGLRILGRVRVGNGCDGLIGKQEWVIWAWMI